MLVESILGVISGVGVNIVTSIISYKNKQLELEKVKIEGEYKIKEIEAMSKATIAEAEANLKRDIIVTEGAYPQKELDVIAKGYEMEDKRLTSDKSVEKLFKLQGWLKYFGQIIGTLITTLFAINDFIKAMLRPFITIYQIAISTWLTYLSYQMLKLHGDIISHDYAREIFTKFVDTTLYLTITIITWYFTNRSIRKDIKDMTYK